MPSARRAGVARVEGFRLVLDKRGADGSAKVNLAPAAEVAVWGIVYALDAGELPLLDRAEGGYARLSVRAACDGAGPFDAWTYVSERRTRDGRAFAWYRRLVVEGAREHGLPASWLRILAALPVRPDDPEREPRF